MYSATSAKKCDLAKDTRPFIAIAGMTVGDTAGNKPLRTAAKEYSTPMKQWCHMYRNQSIMILVTQT